MPGAISLKEWRWAALLRKGWPTIVWIIQPTAQTPARAKLIDPLEVARMLFTRGLRKFYIPDFPGNEHLI